jgi:hypothetical protein
MKPASQMPVFLGNFYKIQSFDQICIKEMLMLQTIHDIKDSNWATQKMCVDVGEYELSVELQKTHWNCEQKKESWKWTVSYHGSIVASGSVNSMDDARQKALSNMPIK